MSAFLLGVSLLLTVSALPVLAEGQPNAGPALGGGSNISVPYTPSQGGTYIPGVPSPDSGTGTFIPGVPSPDSGTGTFIPGVPNPDSGTGTFIPGVPNPDNGTGTFIPGVPNPYPADGETGKISGVRMVKLGEKFTITLKENPSTGYVWSYKANPGTGLTQTDISSSAGKESSKTVGAEGSKTWTFLANTVGTYELIFTNAREFGSSSPVKTQAHTIIVK